MSYKSNLLSVGSDTEHTNVESVGLQSKVIIRDPSCCISQSVLQSRVSCNWISPLLSPCKKKRSFFDIQSNAVIALFAFVVGELNVVTVLIKKLKEKKV